MYLSPLERLQLLLINFPETFSPSAPTPLAPAIIYLHCVFPHRPPSTPPLCPLPPPPHLTTNLPVSPVAAHACRRWDIAFLILLTGANIYVLFFDIHCSSSRRTVGPSRDTRSPTLKKKHRLLPCLCLFRLLTRFPLPENLPLWQTGAERGEVNSVGEIKA